VSVPVIGLFGKLPSHGDFLAKRLPDGFRDVWDEWLQRCLVHSQGELGERWLDCYLTSPMWRFFLADGIAGAASHAGVLLPSVDRVGRYFPLTVLVELPSGVAALPFAQAAAGWFGEVERICSEALEDPALDLQALERELAASGERLSGLDGLRLARPFPGSSTHWHWPARSSADLAAALGAPLMSCAQTVLRPMSLWWTDGSQLVRPCVLLTRGLPRPESFTALLAGTWSQGGWDGEVAMDESEGQPPASAADALTASAGSTDSGPVRSQNQDAFVCCQANRIWAVADGMGGYRDGDVASQMVVDALNALEPTASLDAAMHSVDVALSRVNADLRRAALGIGQFERCGSTVVVLVIRGVEWAVAWAGDSRAYLLRAGVLTCLTQDHSTAFEESADNTASGRAVIAAEITRAVGGDDLLELDRVSDRLAAADRFLLCSDGLYRALDEPAILRHIEGLPPEEASRALVSAACAAGARDNVTAVIVDVREILASGATAWGSSPEI
jgi:type VI secretion system protein ImpM